MAQAWIYPHKPEYAGELGIVHFRMNLEARLRSEPYWDKDWPTSTRGAKAGDTVVFAFKEGVEWYVVGDAIILRIDEAKKDSGWTSSPRYEAFRLYPRNISYSELRINLASFNPDARQRVRLTGSDYLELLALAVKPA